MIFFFNYAIGVKPNYIMSEHLINPKMKSIFNNNKTLFI